jgi:hypothetical protein
MAHIMKLVLLLFVVILFIENNRVQAESAEMEDDSDSAELQYGPRELFDTRAGECIRYKLFMFHLVVFINRINRDQENEEH